MIIRKTNTIDDRGIMSSDNKANSDIGIKRRPRWKDLPPLPEFWDASSTVAASTFAARRLPELKSLYHHSVTVVRRNKQQLAHHDDSSSNSTNNTTLQTLLETTAGSTGRKISSRHLRRRATSHLGRRKRHRFPTGRPAATDDIAKPLACRRKRRKPAQLQREHEQWMRRRRPQQGDEITVSIQQDDSVLETTDASVNNATDSTCSAAYNDTAAAVTANTTTVNWLPTHIWHAKRFRLQTLWNWQVPVLHSQRGAGAAVRLLWHDQKTLVQDVTWCMQPLCLRITSCGEAAIMTGSSGSDPDDVGNHSILQTLVALKRIIPSLTIAPTALDLTIQLFDDSMLYELDQFPRGAIGPVRCCLARNQPLLGFDDEKHDKPTAPTANDDSFLYIWSHPSIQTKLHDLLSLVIRDSAGNVQGPYRSSQLEGISMACLRLRGRCLKQCLQLSIDAALGTDREHHAGKESSSELAIVRALSGEAVRLSVSEVGGTSPTSLVLLPCARQLGAPTVDDIDSMEILCDVSMAKNLFLALVMHGGACPIGMVEEASLLMEASPPIPIFPRDYPDTQEGETYWKGLCDDWGYVRRHWEGGTGRIRPTAGSELKCISWKDLVGANCREFDAIRGAFGKILSDALQSAGIVQHCITNDRESQGRKRRRPSRAPWQLAHASPLSQEQATKHAELCNSLVRSLTLPATILCHVKIFGKGTMAPGVHLRSMGKDNGGLALGFVTSCSFSPSRGAFHGFAVCGAARWLQAVSSASRDAALLVGTTTGGEKELLLLVTVGGNRANNPALGCLSLIL